VKSERGEERTQMNVRTLAQHKKQQQKQTGRTTNFVIIEGNFDDKCDAAAADVYPIGANGRIT
jgi:hypothetical protein